MEETEAMTFLSLAQGDPIGKDLLKKLVISRYGFGPPAMETVRVTFQGRTRAKFGPFPVWASVEAVASYHFPAQMRWDFRVRLLRIFRSSYTTSFDGETVYEQRGIYTETITGQELVQSARRRAWSETVFFISPLLADYQVRVESIDDHSFRARMPGSLDDYAIVRLNDDHTLKEIEIERVDPLGGARKQQYIRPVGGLLKVEGGLLLPEKIQRFWGDDMFMELSPVKVEMNPALTREDFMLREEEDDEAETETVEEADAEETSLSEQAS